MTNEEVFEQLCDILSDFEGRTYDEPITRETMFFQDLGFASIDAVVLGEQLETHFGQKLHFNPFLSELSAQGARDIAVGALTDFLTGSLAESN